MGLVIRLHAVEAPGHITQGHLRLHIHVLTQRLSQLPDSCCMSLLALIYHSHQHVQQALLPANNEHIWLMTCNQETVTKSCHAPVQPEPPCCQPLAVHDSV